MSDLTPWQPEGPTRISADAYFALVGSGKLAADDRVELLEGVIVEVAPMSPRHAATRNALADLLKRSVGKRAAVRVQSPLVVSPLSAPEPDIAIVPGSHADYAEHHPRRALLVVEVAGRSLQPDRLSKSRIYAQAAVPEYWIVNLRDGIVEVMRDPDASLAIYRDRRTLAEGREIELVGVPGVRLEVAAIVPARSGEGE